MTFEPFPERRGTARGRPHGCRGLGGQAAARSLSAWDAVLRR